jgi:hypothetical protein
MKNWKEFREFLNVDKLEPAYKGWRLDVLDGRAVVRVEEVLEWKRSFSVSLETYNFSFLEGGNTLEEAFNNLTSKIENHFKNLVLSNCRDFLRLKNNQGATLIIEDGKIKELTQTEIKESGPFVVSYKEWETIINKKETKLSNNILFSELLGDLSFKFFLLFLFDQTYISLENKPQAVGVWKSAGSYYLDLSTFLSNKQAAFSFARDNEQQAIYEATGEKEGNLYFLD